ncbi:MAG: hypothetical protein C0483_11670 [Pirellula sp.]|nr:hypothetical protein [Pirellula sp.]
MAIAFVLLLLVAGGVAAVWRPWDQRSEQSAVALPSNKVPPVPQASIATPTLPESTPPIVELPPAPVAPSPEQKLPQTSPSVVEPVPMANYSSPPIPSVKPSSSSPSAPVLVQKPAITEPPPSTPSIVRKPGAPPPKYDRAPLAPGTEGTQPVSPQTPLRAGDHLHGQYEGRWYAVTVVESVNDGTVRVRWDTWGKDIVGSISRLRLRLPAKK